jgi:hypothetical protein
MNFNAEEIEELKALEQALLQDGMRKSPNRLAETLAEEFVEFGSSGKVYDKQRTIKALSQSSGDEEISISQFSALRLAPNLALVTYRSRKQKPGANQVDALHSSVWRRTKNGWRILFHQGTPAAIAGDAADHNNC